MRPATVLLVVTAGATSPLDQVLVKSLLNCPLCAGHEACLSECRIDQRKGWDVCLNLCLSDNPLVASTIYSMAQTMSGKAVAGRVGSLSPDEEVNEEA